MSGKELLSHTNWITYNIIIPQYEYHGNLYHFKHTCVISGPMSFNQVFQFHDYGGRDKLNQPSPWINTYTILLLSIELLSCVQVSRYVGSFISATILLFRLEFPLLITSYNTGRACHISINSTSRSSLSHYC